MLERRIFMSVLCCKLKCSIAANNRNKNMLLFLHMIWKCIIIFIIHKITYTQTYHIQICTRRTAQCLFNNSIISIKSKFQRYLSLEMLINWMCVYTNHISILGVLLAFIFHVTRTHRHRDTHSPNVWDLRNPNSLNFMRLVPYVCKSLFHLKLSFACTKLRFLKLTYVYDIRAHIRI